MKRWEKFEIECCDYLNKKLVIPEIAFRKKGGSSSIDEDIEIARIDTNEPLGKIETKLCPAQSGQFSLTEALTFSELNIWPINESTKQIVSYIQENKGLFSDVKQKGIPILCKEDWLIKWVKDHYKRKGTQFIMTSKKLHGFKRVIPIDHIDQYFYIKASVRRKKSGSSPLPIKERERACLELKEHSKQIGFTCTEWTFNKQKTFTYIESPQLLKKKELSFGEKYYLSKSNKNKCYSIRKKSSTNNINVVFSIAYKGEEKDGGLAYIEEFVREMM